MISCLNYIMQFGEISTVGGGFYRGVYVIQNFI